MRFKFLVAALIIAFALWQVIKTNFTPTQKKVIERQVLPMDKAYEKTEAVSYINRIRAAMKMQQLYANKHLQQAGQAHADYLVINNEESHYEMEGQHGFMGVNAVDRAFKTGYKSAHVLENISTKNENAHRSVDSLFSAIYHRFSFLGLDIDEIGVGIQQNKSDTHQNAFVYNMGNSELNRLCTQKSYDGRGKYVYNFCSDKSHRIEEKSFHSALNGLKQYNPKIILYPYDGQQEVPPAFYEEVPDPLPDHTVSGFPVSIMFNDYFFEEVTLHAFKLYKESGENITEVMLMDRNTDPHRMFTKHQYVLFPLKRLDYDTRYRVEAVYESNGKKENVVWHFKTQTPKEKLYIITKAEETLYLKNGNSYMLYFQPLGPHEVITDIQFPNDLYLEFLDNHTIKVTSMSDDLDSFDIVSDTRILHIVME